MSKEIRTTEQILQEDFNWTVDGDPGRYSLFVNLIKPAMKAYHSQFTTPSTTVEQAAEEYAFTEDEMYKMWEEGFKRGRGNGNMDGMGRFDTIGFIMKQRGSSPFLAGTALARDAVEFAEWIKKNMWSWSLNGEWFNNETNVGERNAYITTPELYQSFLKSKNK